MQDFSKSSLGFEKGKVIKNKDVTKKRIEYEIKDHLYKGPSVPLGCGDVDFPTCFQLLSFFYSHPLQRYLPLSWRLTYYVQYTFVFV